MKSTFLLTRICLYIQTCICMFIGMQPTINTPHAWVKIKLPIYQFEITYYIIRMKYLQIKGVNPSDLCPISHN